MAQINVYPYLSPRVIEVLAPDTEISVQELVNLVRDWEDDDTNAAMSFDSLIDAAGKENLGGGELVGITATLQNAQIYFTARSTPLDDGSGRTCDANDTGGRQLYVDDATFQTLGVDRGDVVYNKTTGAMATILEVVDENTVNHFQLSGGSSIQWTVGDEYVIYDQVQCNISGGNLVAVDDVGADLNPVLESPLVQVVRTASSSATLLEQENAEFILYEGTVTIDPVNGVAGTTAPIGTTKLPSNNLTDAITIANNNGFTTIELIGFVTATASHNLDGLEVTGGTGSGNVIVLSGATTDMSSFNRLIVVGALNGLSRIKDCILGTTGLGGVTGMEGRVVDCIINNSAGIIQNATGAGTLFDNCSFIAPDDPQITLNANGKGFSLRECTGNILVTNKTDIEADQIHINGARLELDSTCTGGVITVDGSGLLTDNSSGTTVVNNLFNPDKLLTKGLYLATKD